MTNALFRGARVVAITVASCIPTAVVAAAAGTTATPEAAEAELAEVIVTAEKQSSDLQRTPVAVTAVGGETLYSSGIEDLRNIKALVPNMQFTANSGVGQISIRGVGISNVVPWAEGSVAVNLDQVYVSRPTGITSSFYDVDGIEVLRGPQGTLYGRNATGGSINIKSKMPTEETAGYARVTLGNYNTVNLEGAVSGPIMNDLLVRLAVYSQNHSGYGTNVATGRDIDDKDAKALRLTLLYKPFDNFKATLIADYYHENDASGGQHYIGPLGNIGVPGQSNSVPTWQLIGGFSNTRLVDEAGGIDPQFELSTGGVSANLAWDLAPFTITSISAFRGQQERFFNEVSTGYPSTYYIKSAEPARQWSEELRLNFDANRLHAIGGLYYFGERDTCSPCEAIVSTYLLTGDTANLNDWLVVGYFPGHINTDSKAVFGQLKFDVTDNLSLSAAGRYTDESKTATQQFGGFGASFTQLPGPPFTTTTTEPTFPVVERSARFHATTPKAGIDYQVTARTLLYASYSKGFRAGTFDLISGPTVPALEPETLTDYEAGIKTTLFDNRLRANLAAFHYDYKNMQLSISNGSAIIIQNAPGARLYGAEAEISALVTPQLEVDLAAGYLHSAFLSYPTINAVTPNLPPLDPPNPATVNFKGNQLPNAPEFTLHAAAEYSFVVPMGRVAARGELDYQSVNYLSADNFTAEAQRAFVKLNAFVSYDSGRNWKLSAYGRNLTNKITVESTAVGAGVLGTVLKGDISAPRTFGVTGVYTLSR